MVKVRRAVSPAVSHSSLGKRKRSEQDYIDVTSSSKRDSGPTVVQSHDRARTPSGKSARFPRDLISGPTPGNPERARSQSPVRSALHMKDTPNDGPSAQLRAEAQASLDQAKTPRLYPNLRKQNPARQHSPAGQGTYGKQRESGLTQSLGHMEIVSSNPSKRGSTAKNRVQVEEYDDELDDALVTSGSTSGTKDTTPLIATAAQQSDDEICRQMEELRADALNFAKSCPPVALKHKHNALEHLLVKENEQLVRYIGCLAIGGQTGEQGWEMLLGDTTCRRALVLGIVGRALKENVFNELYFGGSLQLTESLSKLEKEQTHQDGFFRTERRAAAIRKHNSKQNDSVSFRTAVARVTLQLEYLLYPLWEQGNVSKQTWITAPNRHELAKIVAAAGHLSRLLRTSANVVYYWPPTLKDEEFEPGWMECLNIKAMISESPYDKKDINGFERAVLREGLQDESEAIVRVVCFPGLVAYRQYGGDLAKQELLDEENERREREGREKLPPDVQRHRKMLASREKTLTGDEGFRTRVISKSVVLLQWGKQRLLTKEAGTSRHIDAMKGKGAGMKKYENDYTGFKELHDLYLEKVQDDPQRGAGILGVVTGLFSRSPSASVEPPLRNLPVARSGSRSGRPGTRGR